MVARTAWAAAPAFSHSGLGLVTGTTWNPAAGVFGGLPFIYGTLVTSVIALLLAVPVSVLIALFVSEVAPPGLGTALGFVVDLLAAVPSVVYGLWGVFVLVPFLTPIWQWLSSHLGFIPLFSQFGSGRDFATAGVILALMIIPIISAVSREIFRTVPPEEREAALAIGATRWEMIRLAVLPRSRSGVVAAVMLGFGRAVGETIAVAYLIGGFPKITSDLFQQGSTIAANIALQFNEASSQPLFKAALIALGVILFGLTLLINIGARLIIRSGGTT
jgi:phosphate transport system permease protein